MSAQGAAKIHASANLEAYPVKGTRTLPYTALAVAVLATSVSSILIRYSSAPALALSFYRLFLTVLILLGPLLLRYRGELLAMSRRDLALSTASGVFLALHFWSWIASLKYTSVASSVVLVTLHPFFVLAGGYFLYHERTTRLGLLGAGLAVVGTALIGFSDFGQGQDSLFGDVLAFLGAITMSGYLLIGRTVRQRLSLVPYVVTVYAIASATLAAISWLANSPLAGFPQRDWLIFLGLAVFPTIFGHTVFNWALRYLPAALVSVTILGEPLGSSVLAFFILAEMPALLALAGGLLILTGIAIFVLTVRETE